MGQGFHPFRRDVTYAKAAEADPATARQARADRESKQNWGYSFRFGLVEISKRDFETIARPWRGARELD